MNNFANIFLATAAMAMLSVAGSSKCRIEKIWVITSMSCKKLGFTSMDNVTGPRGIVGSLELEYNHITELSKSDFDGFGHKLLWLYFSNNGITKLASGVFDRLTGLRLLVLSVNKISFLPSGVFDNLSKLRLLSLEYNKLSDVTTGVFDKLPVLRTLSLAANEITTLPAHVFDNNIRLHILDLEGNNIARLPDKVFSNLVNLKELDVYGNTFENLNCTQFCGKAVLRTYPGYPMKSCFGKTLDKYCKDLQRSHQ